MNNKKNALWNMIGSGTFSVSSFALLVVVSRVFGIEVSGDFGIAQSTSQLLYIVGLFGANTYQMTDYKEKYKFDTYATVKLCSSVLMLLGAVITAVVYQNWFRAFLIVGMSLYMCVYSYADLYHSYFFQKNRLDLSGKSLFYQSLLSSISFTLVAVVMKNLLCAVACMIAVNVIVTYCFSVRVYNGFNNGTNEMQEKNDKLVVQELLREVLPLFASLFLMNIMTNLSKYFIDYYESQAVVGAYSTLFIVFAVINLLSGFVFKPSLNQYGKLLHENKVHDYVVKLLKQIVLVVTLTAFAALMAYLIGTTMLSWVYSADLVQYKLELALICIGGGEIAISSLIYYQLAILRKQSYIMLSYGVGVLVEAVMCLLFVPRLGMIGGIISFIIAYAVLTMLLVCELLKNLNEKKSLQ